MTRGAFNRNRNWSRAEQWSSPEVKGVLLGTLSSVSPIRNQRHSYAAAMTDHQKEHDQQQQSEDEIDELASIDELEDLDAVPTPSTPPHVPLPHIDPTAEAEFTNMAEEAYADEWQPETPPLPPQLQVDALPSSSAPASQREAQTQITESLSLPESQLESDTEIADDVASSLTAHTQSLSQRSNMTNRHRSQTPPDSPGPTSSKPIRSPSSPAEPQVLREEEEEEAEEDDGVPRKSLFDIEDAEETQRIEEMYALLTATKEDLDSDAESDESDAAYEARRQRKLLENQRLLAQLGLGPQGPAEGQEPAPPSPSGSDVMLGSPSKPFKDLASPEPEKPKTKSKRRNGHWERKVLKLAEDGTTTTLPLPGTVHELAYIDVLPVRERARDDYLFIDHFAIRAPTPTPPPAPVEKPRQTRASGSKPKETTHKEKAARAKAVKRAQAGLTLSGKARQRRSKEEMAELDSETATSGSTCHQCRRKSLEPKMYCRQVGYIGELAAMQCALQYCQGCCSVRYGIGQDEADSEQWDVGNPGWTCPRCRGICNCTLCMHKADMAHHLPQSGPGVRTLTLSSLLKDKSGKMKYRSVKHYLEEAKGVTQIGPKRVLAPDLGSDSMRGILDDIARLKDELHVIRERRRYRAMSRYASLQEEEVGGHADLSTDDRPTKRSRSASQDRSSIDMVEDGEEKLPRPKLTVKLRKPPRPVEPAEGSLGPTSTLAAIMAWQNSLDAQTSAASHAPPAKQRASTRSHSLPKKAFEARESDVWIKGAADQYESDSDPDLLDESAEDQDEMEAEERGGSDDSTLTSLSELMSWRQSSPLCGADAEAGDRRVEGTQAIQQHGPEAVATEADSTGSEREEPALESEGPTLHGAPLQASQPPAFEEHLFPTMQVDTTSLRFGSSYLDQHVPQLSYSADASSASTSSSADFGLSTRLASPWITNPYSAKGQGSLGVVSHFTHHHTHGPMQPHMPSRDVSEQNGQASGLTGRAEHEEEEEEEDAPLYPATWPLRVTSTTDSTHSAMVQSTAPPPAPSPPPPPPRQMYFSPTSAWQHQTRT